MRQEFTGLFLVVFLKAFSIYAQDLNQERFVFRANIIGGSIGLEHKLFSASTLYATGGLAVVSKSSQYNVSFLLVPFAQLQARFYYNLEKRKANNKRVDKYSGNYTGLLVMQTLETYQVPSLTQTGIIWGEQRSYREFGYWGFYVGGGFMYSRAFDRYPVLISKFEWGIAFPTFRRKHRTHHEAS